MSRLSFFFLLLLLLSIQKPCFVTPRFKLYLRRRNRGAIKEERLMHVNKVNLQRFIPCSAANNIIRSRSFRFDRVRIFASELEKN